MKQIMENICTQLILKKIYLKLDGRGGIGRIKLIVGWDHARSLEICGWVWSIF